MNKNFAFIIVVILIAVGIMFFLQDVQKKHAVKTEKKLTPFTVVLDWTPNTNHTGMYVALGKGWYEDEGLDVKILPYSDNASADVLLQNGKADVGVGNTEGILTAAANGKPLVSIAAIVAHNTSGFLALGDRGIESPKDFDGKLYGGYGSPVETAIVGAIIKNAGGEGDFKNVNLGVDAMQALESRQIDFYWVFEGWEVVDARQKGHNVKYFDSLAYGIPDYYTPNLVTTPEIIKERGELLQRFMTATKKGYEFAQTHPKEAAQILIFESPKGTFPNMRLVFDSQEFLSPKYADRGKPWGVQEKKMWEEYPQFLIDAGAVLDKNGNVVKSLDFDSLYTNEFLK